jgi:hypothetical protein
MKRDGLSFQEKCMCRKAAALFYRTRSLRLQRADSFACFLTEAKMTDDRQTDEVERVPDGNDTALSISNALNANTNRDAVRNRASDTIVNVHPWSTHGPSGGGSGDPMSNLNQLVQWLDPSKVQLVTLEELMVHLRNNFGTPFYFQLESLTVSDDVARMRLTGPPGRNVVLEGSVNLQAWTPVQTHVLVSGGLDLLVPLGTSRIQFFRARITP